MANKREKLSTKGGGGHPPIVCDEMVDFVIEQLARRKFKSQIKLAIEDACSSVGVKTVVNVCTVDWLIRLARLKMQARCRQSRGEHKVDAVAFLEDVIRRDDTYIKDKLAAQEQLTSLTGADYATELEERKLAAGMGGDKSADAERLRKILKGMDESVDGQAAPE